MAAGLWALVIAFAWAQLGCKILRSPEIVGDVPLFETTAWQIEGDLFLRSSGEDEEDLLLMHQKLKQVYRWDPSNSSLEITVPYEDWERATGPIDAYESEFPSSPLNLRRFLESFKFSPEGGWMVRSEAPDKDTLLLTHLSLEMVYQYDRATRELALVPHEHWEASGEEIVECPTLENPSGLRIESRRTPSDPRLDRLLAGDRVIRTVGARALTMSESPSERFAAVLSADGERRESLMPFSGPGGADGQHFHELLSLADFTRVGEPVRLPMTTKDIVSLTSCWSPDERYVVYADLSAFRVLSIVPIDVPPQQERQ
jgi:hypothetical protein